MKYQRFLLDSFKAALEDTPVLLLNGARQCGKNTIMHELIAERPHIPYITLDDLSTLASVQSDPLGFLSRFQDSVVIDEIQRAPELFLQIKQLVDKNRKPGRFLLTGSANVLLLPKLADSLSGRMEIFTLFPLSVGEIKGQRQGLVNILLQGTAALITHKAGYSTSDLMEMALRGGYPEMQSRPSIERRASWFQSYITTLLQKDVRDLANIEELTRLPSLLSLLAARSAGLLNLAELSRSIGIPLSSLNRYFTLLETLFLIYKVPAWSNNRSKRLIKTSKIYLNDTGLLCHLLRVNKEALEADPHLWGRVLETFVAGELMKQISWSAPFPKLYHYRNASGQEVDFVLEIPNGQIVGIKVKASSNISSSDFKGLKFLAAEEPKKFSLGIVLYAGTEVLPFGDNCYAVPLI